MVVGVVLAALTSHVAQAVLCDVDWFQGVWVQDWGQPKWIVRRGNRFMCAQGHSDLLSAS